MELKKIVDYFYILRPTLFFPGITIFLFGVKDGNGLNPISFISLLLFLSIMYLTNQIYDIENDRFNNKLFFLSKDIISKKNALIPKNKSTYEITILKYYRRIVILDVVTRPLVSNLIK